MKFLQKLGKALMLPVAVLPICGILMGVGYLLCPETMQGGDINGIVPVLGLFLVKAGGALIDNMAILFAIGIGVGMADDNDGTAGLAALASWLMITTLLSTGVASILRSGIEDNPNMTLAFDTSGLAVFLQRKTLRSNRSWSCFHHCFRNSAVCMAAGIRRTDRSR